MRPSSPRCWVRGRGFAVGCGINPRYGDLDPYAMAAAAVDEAVRNVVAVGADPSRIALLDNFCWGDTDRPEVLGSLVRAAEACRDVALAYNLPFISGKDSLKNEYHAGGRNIVIPPTLLISALGLVPDVRRCVTMDLKEPGNILYLLGATKDEMGGSHYHLVHGLDGGAVPRVDLEAAPRLFRQLHEAIARGLVRACHDLSEGGLAVAVAEMAFAGGVGADLTGWAKTGGLTRRGAAVLGIADSVYRRSDGGERGGVRGVRRRHAADAAGTDMQGTAAADRGGERRMGGVGGAEGPQGGMAGGDAVLSGDVPRATCCACLSGEHPASFSLRVMFRDRPADRSCDLTAADGRRLDRRRPRIIRGLGANQAEVDQGAARRGTPPGESRH